MSLLGKSGILGIVVIGGALYYSGAGTWLWQRVERLDSACFSGLSQMGAGSNISNPVCGGLAKGIQALNQLGETIERGVSDMLPHNPFGGVEATLDGLSQGIHERISALSSSSESLNQLMRRGPSLQVGSNVRQQFQTAVDSFTIGQHLINTEGNSAQALPWLEQGAAQPGGMGVMSQLSLANLYGTGSHGVAANPTMASRYLREANQSLGTLEASGSVESRHMIEALPMRPAELRQQIESALRQLQPESR